MNIDNIKVEVLNEEAKITQLNFNFVYNDKIESHQILINVNSKSTGEDVIMALAGISAMVCAGCDKKYPETDIVKLYGVEPFFCECGSICNPEFLFDNDILETIGMFVVLGVVNDKENCNEKITEKSIEDLFCTTLTCEFNRQVKTPHGIIDILTDDCIYEVKLNPILSTLHNAYGQLKHYQHHYPDRKLAIVANKFPEGYTNKEVKLIICEVERG